MFIFHAETDKLCLKDLSRDVTNELDRRLQADKAAMEKFCQFFGLSLTQRFGLTDLKDLFPDTPVSVLKKCFEALRMCDLVEIMEKVKSRSLRPALSPEQIEKLWRADNRPTKYHSNVAVLVVGCSVEGHIVKRDEVKKIETFFKDLNSRNEVAIISLISSRETQEALRKIKERISGIGHYHLREDILRKNLKSMLQQKELLEKQLEEVLHMEKERKLKRRLEMAMEQLEQREFKRRGDLENIAKVIKQAERDFEKLKEREKENTKPISKAMDEWIHNQG